LEIKAFLARGHFATSMDLEEWFGVQDLKANSHKGTFEFAPTGQPPARYISTSHAFKAMQLAKVLAVDPEVPIEEALAVLRYVFAQASEQDAPPSHLTALHAACTAMTDQLASSALPALKQRAAAIEAFLAGDHPASRK